jgi:undecaprenyl-diphosphatase
MTSVTVEIIIFFLLTSLFLWRERKRKWILPLWAALGFSSIVSFLIKILVQRPRPFQLDLVAIFPVLESASFLTWNFSFPSLQAALVFSAIPILSKEFPRLKWVWIVFAGLVALSRVYFGLHFMSDVIVGGLIGFLVGSLIVRLEKENNFWENVYGKIFRKR